MLQKPAIAKTKDQYNSSLLNERNQMSKIKQDLQDSFLKHNGWVNVLGKYINISTGHVTSEIPIDIVTFQQDIVKKFSNFLISTDDLYSYFLSIKNQLITIPDQEAVTFILSDLVRELSSPAYYRECVDCQFFQQKCERMRRLLENNFDEAQFKEFLEFLSQKRKLFTEQATTLKTQLVTQLVGQASKMRKKREEVVQQKTGIKKFFGDCQLFVLLEDESGNLIPPSSTKKNKIIISNDKNKVSVVYELIQKLSQFEQLKLQEIHCSGTSNFQFELKGNEFSIKGEMKSQKQKAKESCCEIVVNKIIQSLKTDISDDSEDSSEDEDDSEESDVLIFQPEDLFVAELKENKSTLSTVQNKKEQNNNRNDFSMIDEKNKSQEELVTQKQNEESLGTDGNETAKNEQLKKKENLNNYDRILQLLLRTKEELSSFAKLELNPFIILKKLTSDLTKNHSDQYKKMNNWLLQIIMSAVQLYDYEEFKQSPCVLVQENNHTFFLKTIIMKKKAKSQNLVGRVRSMSEEQAFICSALEVIYKFAFKHQSHKGDISSLAQVIEGMVVQAEYLSEEFEKEQKDNQLEKNQFTDKMQPKQEKPNNKKVSVGQNLSCSNVKQQSLKEKFKLVL